MYSYVELVVRGAYMLNVKLLSMPVSQKAAMYEVISIKTASGIGFDIRQLLHVQLCLTCSQGTDAVLHTGLMMNIMSSMKDV